MRGRALLATGSAKRRMRNLAQRPRQSVVALVNEEN